MLKAFLEYTGTGMVEASGEHEDLHEQEKNSRETGGLAASTLIHCSKARQNVH